MLYALSHTYDGRSVLRRCIQVAREAEQVCIVLSQGTYIHTNKSGKQPFSHGTEKSAVWFISSLAVPEWNWMEDDV